MSYALQFGPTRCCSARKRLINLVRSVAGKTCDVRQLQGVVRPGPCSLCPYDPCDPVGNIDDDNYAELALASVKELSIHPDMHQGNFEDFEKALCANRGVRGLPNTPVIILCKKYVENMASKLENKMYLC